MPGDVTETGPLSCAGLLICGGRGAVRGDMTGNMNLPVRLDWSRADGSGLAHVDGQTYPGMSFWFRTLTAALAFAGWTAWAGKAEIVIWLADYSGEAA